MKRFIPAILVIIFVYYLAVFSCVGSFSTYETQFYGPRMEDAQYLNEKYRLDQQPALLYLEPGDAPYFIHANSSCRYIAGLLLSRHRDNWNLSNLQQYRDYESCILNYQGDYIIAELGGDTGMDWIGERQAVHKELMQQLFSNYTVIEKRSWRLLVRKNLIPALPRRVSPAP